MEGMRVASQLCTLVFKMRHWCSDCFMNASTLFAVILLSLKSVPNNGLRSTRLTLHQFASSTLHQFPHTQTYRDPEELLQSQQSLDRQCRLWVVEFLQQKHTWCGSSPGSPGGNYSIGVLVSQALPLYVEVFALCAFNMSWLSDSTLPHRRGDVVTGGPCHG